MNLGSKRLKSNGFSVLMRGKLYGRCVQSCIILVHGQVTIIFVVSVGLSVCAVFLSRL